MITLTDVIGFSDLTEAEVQTLARHEHVTPLEAVFLGCQLMQSPSGQRRILNRVQFETRSASLPKPPGGRRSDPKSMGLELDAV